MKEQQAKCPVCGLNCITIQNVRKHAFKLHGIVPGVIMVN